MPDPIYAQSGPNPQVAQDIPLPMPDFSDLVWDPNTTQQANQRNSLALATAEMRIKNQAAEAYYKNIVWRAFVVRMTSGNTLPPDQQIPPKPPTGYSVSLPNADGLVYCQPSGLPVCAMPPLPTYNGGLHVTTSVAGHISINWDAWRPNSKWVPANKDDGWSDDVVTPPQMAPDGQMHTYQRFPTPFGALYLQQS